MEDALKLKFSKVVPRLFFVVEVYTTQVKISLARILHYMSFFHNYKGLALIYLSRFWDKPNHACKGLYIVFQVIQVNCVRLVVLLLAKLNLLCLEMLIKAGCDLFFGLQLILS